MNWISFLADVIDVLEWIDSWPVLAKVIAAFVLGLALGCTAGYLRGKVIGRREGKAAAMKYDEKWLELMPELFRALSAEERKIVLKARKGKKVKVYGQFSPSLNLLAFVTEEKDGRGVRRMVIRPEAKMFLDENKKLIKECEAED